MASKLGSILVSLEMNTAKFTADTGKAVKSLNTIKTAISFVSADVVARWGAQFLRAGQQIFDMGKNIALAADEIGTMAERLGISTDEWQKWSYVAKQADMDIQGFGMGIRSLTKSMSDFMQGKGEALPYFQALGINIQDATGRMRPMKDVILDIADKFKYMEDGTQKTAIALEIFGSRAGEKMVPLLNMGREGIEKYWKEVEKLGGVIDQNLIKQGEEVDAALKRIDTALVGLKSNLIPATRAVVEFGEALVTAISKGSKVIIDFYSDRRVQGWLTLFMGAAPGGQMLTLFKKWADDAKDARRQAEGLTDWWDRHISKQKKIDFKLVEIEPRGPNRWKDWVESFDWLQHSLEQLGIVSEKTLQEQARNAIRYLPAVREEFQKTGKGVLDYVNALKVANDALKKLTGEDYWKDRLDAETEYQEKSREINREEEGWQKKQNQLIDEYFKKIKEIEKKKIPVHADVAPLEREVNESIAKLEAKGITLKIKTEGGAETGGGGSTPQTMVDYMRGNLPFLGAGGKENALMDLTDIENKLKSMPDLNINAYMTGSTKKPITDKIKEIIDQFGGLEKALSGMEAHIRLAELTAEYKQIERKLAQVQRILPDMSAMSSRAGGSPYVSGPIVQTVQDLIEQYTEQMRIAQMRMQYEMLKGYGGSMQTGGYVPKTGLYKLHEGEHVVSKKLSIGDIHVHVNGGSQDTVKTLVKVLKNKLSNELRNLI